MTFTYNFNTNNNFVDTNNNFIAERSNNRNGGYVNLFCWHEKSWINRKVRSVNLRLDRVLLGCAMSHIRVAEIS